MGWRKAREGCGKAGIDTAERRLVLAPATGSSFAPQARQLAWRLLHAQGTFSTFWRLSQEGRGAAAASYGHGSHRAAGSPSLQSSAFLLIVDAKIICRNPHFQAKQAMLLLLELCTCLRHWHDLSDLFFTAFSVAKASSHPPYTGSALGCAAVQCHHSMIA